jgi:hypothetical protein
LGEIRSSKAISGGLVRRNWSPCLMRNFLRIAAGLDVVPLLISLQHHPELWDSENIRKSYDERSPHKDVNDILLRFSDPSDPKIGDQLVCESTKAWSVLPAAQDLVFGLMGRVRGVMLGRVMVTRLAPGKRILPHADTMGRYANTYKRFHVVLQSEPGCMFRAGDEEVWMRPGEIWDFNAHVEHEVVNASKDDRLHLIVDIRTL